MSFSNNGYPSLSAQEQGSGPPVVLIHGWATSRAIWSDMVGYLSSSHRCLAVDLRGHGATPAPTGPHTLRDHAADVVQFVDQNRLERPVLLGWSMGAQIALEAAARLGEKLAGLLLISGTARFPSGPGYPYGLLPDEVIHLAARLRRNPSKALQRFFTAMFANDEWDEEKRRCRAETLASAAPPVAVAMATLAALSEADARPLLSSIRAPARLFHGENDSIIPVGASAFLAQQLPSARLEILPSAGHAPLLTRAEPLRTLVADFLREVY